MLSIAIILGSTRPGRVGEAVARWVYDIASQRTDAKFELVDVKDFSLPLLDEPIPPSLGRYTQPHTKTWAAKIAEFDAFVFVTAGYNHGIQRRPKTRSISCSASGITRLLALSRTAAPVAHARSNNCGS